MSISELQTNFARPGKLEWIGVRPGRRAPMICCQQVEVKPGMGITGDRFKGNVSSKRQISLIQEEHLSAIASAQGLSDVDPALLRRNLVVSGINLLALKGRQFQLGTAVLEYSGLCHPCSRMEEVLGMGGYNAMRGHGGILAKVVSQGVFSLGSELLPL